MVSGYAAMERGSEIIEPKDLLKAIYIVDLEHVLAYWSTWEGFERFVSAENSPTNTGTYINRMLYLLRMELAAKEIPSGFFGVGRPSHSFHEVVAFARGLATSRMGVPTSPSSGDLLFSVCSLNAGLSESLQKSGLLLNQLEAAVRK